MRRPCLVLALAFSLSAPTFAVTPWDASALADSLAAGTWQQSEKLCREVLPKTTDSQEALAVKYNLGLSLLFQKKNDEAKNLFEAVAKDAREKELRAKASYNLGNTLFAMNKLDDAQKAFEKSLLMDSDDDDARYNIEVILRKKKQDEDKKNQQQKNQDQQDKNQDKDQKDKQQSKNDQQDKDGQKKDGQQDKDKDGKSDESKKGEQKDGEQKGGQGQQSKDQQKGSPKSGKDAQAGKDKGKEHDAQAAAMSEAQKKAAEDAQEKARLLEFFRQQERDNQPRRVGVQSVTPPPGGKTW